MNARALLETIEARGGVATVKRRADGAAVLNVAPRSCCADLLPDLQRFKPALLELLTGTDAPPGTSPPDTRAQNIEASRLRLNRLEARLGTAGACLAIWKASRRLEREQTRFWRRLKASDKHTLSVCFACLEAGIDPDEGEGA